MKQIKVIPFDISLATNDNVYTRDGRKVRILCTDRKDDDFPIVALTQDNIYPDKETYESFTIKGMYSTIDESQIDLFIHQEINVELHFNSFDKVLVRRGEHGIWRPAFYSHESMQDNGDSELVKLHYTIGDRRGYNSNCVIPYDGFQHLCNTTDDPKF